MYCTLSLTLLTEYCLDRGGDTGAALAPGRTGQGPSIRDDAEPEAHGQEGDAGHPEGAGGGPAPLPYYGHQEQVGRVCLTPAAHGSQEPAGQDGGGGEEGGEEGGQGGQGGAAQDLGAGG